MPIRLSGMNSGLDTESIITELVKAKTVKKDNLVKAQTKLQWKQDAWKELNAKVYSLYSKTLSNMRLKSDYSKKATKVSNESVATVITGSNAVNGVQTLKVEQLAKTGYLTGAELQKDNKKASYKETDKLTDLGVEAGSELELKSGDKTSTIKVDDQMTIKDFVTKLRNEGLNASFDEKNQRFFISAKESGEEADFSITAKDAKGMNALMAMGIATPLADDDAARAEYEKYCVWNDTTKKYELLKDTADATPLTDLVNTEIANRRQLFTNSVAELKTVRENIKKIEDNYKNADSGEVELASQKELEDDIAAKEEQLQKDVKLTTEEREALQKKIEELKVELEDRKQLDIHKENETKLDTIVKANENYFEKDADGNFVTDTDGNYKAKVEEGKDLLAEAITNEVNTKAMFAVTVLNDADASSGATRIAGQNAKISLNGAAFVSENNTFEINGLTITAQAETKEGEEVTITTSDDTDGIYDMVKNFLKEYNELINEMDKLYNADAAKGYEPLTEEEKEAMSEKEVEKWEEKIKDSILRRDSTLNTVASAMKQVMLQGVKMEDGSQMYLSDFGINTLGYFTSKDNEKNAYHIDGDKDDAATSANADKLKTAIANDSGKVIDFFSALTKSLYEKLGGLMKKTEYSSSFTLYDDVAMKDEYNDYKSKITAQEEKITDFEDRYYKKFTAMETALAKMSSKESAISGLFNM